MALERLELTHRGQALPAVAETDPSPQQSGGVLEHRRIALAALPSEACARARPNHQIGVAMRVNKCPGFSVSARFLIPALQSLAAFADLRQTHLPRALSTGSSLSAAPNNRQRNGFSVWLLAVRSRST